MKSRNNRPTANAKRPRAVRRLRSILCALLVVSCFAAVCAGSLLPRRSSLVASAKPGAKVNAGPSAVNAQDAEPLSQSVLQQIEALVQEKATRSPAQQKIDSQLLYGLKMDRGEAIAQGVETLAVELPVVEGGEVVVDISANVSEALLDRLKDAGVQVISAFPEYRTIRASVGSRIK